MNSVLDKRIEQAIGNRDEESLTCWRRFEIVSWDSY